MRQGKTGQAFALNDAGQIVGMTRILPKDGPRHAFVWAHGAMADLGTLPGGRSSKALGINERGQIIGSSDAYAVLWTPKR